MLEILMHKNGNIEENFYPNDGRSTRFSLITAESSCVDLTKTKPVLKPLECDEWVYTNYHHPVVIWITKYEINYSHSPQ